MQNQSPEFAVTVLDALTAHIAVLDARGTILDVNLPWREFAANNQGNARDYYIGQNYLAVCERAARGGDADAARLAQALRTVIDGRSDHFAMEYPCNSPDRQRWFIARVTRCQIDGAHYVVVAHDDITARKLAEIGLAAADRELRAAKQALEASNHALQRALERAELLARTDELTGVHRRRHFFALAIHALRVAQRYRQPLSLVMFDIDHFKHVNDRFGHPAGDAVLQEVAARVTRHLRASDVFARYGGEEFAILMPDTDVGQAQQLAERIRTAIEAAPMAVDHAVVSVTISLGVAGRGEGDGGLRDLIRHADAALYAAKAAGRNRISVHDAHRA